MKLGLRVKLLILAALIWAVIFGIYSVYIYKERIEQTRRMAVTSAAFISKEVLTERQIYTSTVIKKALDAGLKVTDSTRSDNSIPLPITFLKEVSEALSSEGEIYLNLVSLNPINQNSAPKDDFHREGLTKFLNGTDTRHHRFEEFKGKQSVRYMVPDVAGSQTCVDCHNAHPSSPKRNYRIGDVMGGLEVVIPIQSEMAVAMADVWKSIGYGFVVVAVMGLVGMAIIRKFITAPISELSEATRHLAMGDLTREVEILSGDELGDLGARTNEVTRNLHRMIEDIRRTSDEAMNISLVVREMSRRVLEGSEKQKTSLDSIGSSMEEISSSASQVAGNTESLAASIEKGSASIQDMSSGINEVLENTESLFASVEETASSTKDLSHAIREISDNVENLSGSIGQVTSSMLQINSRIREVEINAAEASRFADDVIRDAGAGMKAVDNAIGGIINIKDITRESTSAISSLCEKINEIGKILDFIREVSEETNLLALNAAIIAAQSGEHGKSFSVVANEIKDLAERVSTSAREVTDIISGVDSESKRAFSAMERGVASVEDGVRLSMESGEGLRKILSSARRSTESVREIARASMEQAKESRMVVEAIEKVGEMTRRIVNATQEQARDSELINKATERMSEIAYRVKGSTWSQVEANRQMTATMDDVNRMVIAVNNMIRELSRNTRKVLEATETVRRVSLGNMGNMSSTDSAVESMAKLNRELLESVKRFRLRR